MKKSFTSILFIFIFSFFIIKTVSADAVIDNGLNFLKSKQDSSGRINAGFSAPSQWSAIAFAANGIDIATIKNPSVSLKDFLLSNVPGEPSSATDWETRILAIIATDGDPTNYGSINYVSRLESFFSNNQIGDICSLNDDIFGLLAEIAAGSSANIQIKQAVLSYLISKQDIGDGGFGYSTPGCSYYSTSADMTGAAVQALVAAKKSGLTDSGLETAIDQAKNYLLKNQDSDGGYGYYGSSDTDTTGWVLMAFNALDMKDSSESASTKNWLISQQSKVDGGIQAFDYGTNTFVSNSSTTAQAMIALAGKSWILKIFDPINITPAPTLSVTPTVSPTVTPTITPTPNPSQNIIETPTLTPTEAPTVTPEPYVTNNVTVLETISPSQTPTQKITGVVLGASSQKSEDFNAIFSKVFTGLGVITLAFYGFLKLYFFLNI